MKFYYQIILVYIFLTGIGCGGHRNLTYGPPLSESELIASMEQRSGVIKTFYAEGSISYESEEISNSGSFQLYIIGKDSARIDIRGPFGIRAATILLTAKEGIYLDWLENRAFYSSDYSKSPIIPFPLELRQLISILTSGFPDLNTEDSLYGFTVMPEAYSMKFISSKGKKEISVERDTFIGKSYKFFEGDTTASMIIDSYGSMDSGGISFPETIRINDNGQKSNITLFYDNIELNGKVTCSFNLPKSAKVIYR